MISCSVTASTAETFWRSPSGLARFGDMVNENNMAEQRPLDVQARQALNLALIGAQFRSDAEVNVAVQKAASATSARYQAARESAIRYKQWIAQPSPSLPAVWVGSTDRAAQHDSFAVPAPPSFSDSRFRNFQRILKVQRS